MSVLVTGGAGFIGSHMALALLDRGERVVILDNLATGVRACLPGDALFVEGDVGDEAELRALFAAHDIDAVAHFAASTVVPDSVRDPLAYYRNNTANTRTLIAAAVEAGVRHFVFSSTAAVYGVPDADLVSESAPTDPISPYGASKLMSERILRDVSAAHGLRVAILRYFNVAGADPQGRSGQSTPRATHLIKACLETALGQRDYIDVFGEDYPTPDGTGVRDYIHVSDLIDAHLAALDRLRGGARSLLYNCGYGRGYSVRQVIDAVTRVAGVTLPVRTSPRREGDAAKVVADARAIRAELGWAPRHDDLDTIVAHALQWERSRQFASICRAPLP
jgi:UDP-glucose 4-epimerase